jgi:hypothetical protein
MKNYIRPLFVVTTLLIPLLSGCNSQGPAQSQVEALNTEIKSNKPANLPPAPPPTDVTPGGPGMAGPKKGGR